MSKIVGKQSIRESAELTASYVAATEINVYSATSIVILIQYTMGSAETSNAVVFKVEWSDDNGTTYYQDANYLYNTTSVSGGAVTVDKTEYTYGADSAAGTYDRIAVPVPVLGKQAKISFKETGVSSNYGTCAADVLLLEEI